MPVHMTVQLMSKQRVSHFQGQQVIHRSCPLPVYYLTAFALCLAGYGREEGAVSRGGFTRNSMVK